MNGAARAYFCANAARLGDQWHVRPARRNQNAAGLRSVICLYLIGDACPFAPSAPTYPGCAGLDDLALTLMDEFGLPRTTGGPDSDASSSLRAKPFCLALMASSSTVWVTGT